MLVYVYPYKRCYVRQRCMSGKNYSHIFLVLNIAGIGAEAYGQEELDALSWRKYLIRREKKKNCRN